MRSERNVDKGQRLLDDILSNPGSASVELLANELLRECHRGYPIKNLRCLLVSQTDDLVKAGVWIVSELGNKATPLLDNMSRLLNHSLSYVRFFAIDSVLTCATSKEDKAIVAVILMLNDNDASVRWKAIDFLSRATGEQLRAAHNHFMKSNLNSVHVVGLESLLEVYTRDIDVKAVSLLQNANSVLKKYGVALATRIAMLNINPLLTATSLDDFDVQKYAKAMIKLKGM